MRYRGALLSSDDLFGHCVDATNGYVYLLHATEQKVRRLNLNTLCIDKVANAFAATYHQLAAIGADLVAAGSWDVNTPATVQPSTGSVSVLGAADWIKYGPNEKGQTAAANISNGRAYFIAYSSNTVLVKVVSGAASTIDPAGWAGKQLSCIAKINSGNDFLVGTTDGLVYVLDASETATLKITLPTTPNAGSAPNHIITGLACDSTLSRCIVGTNNGLIYLYDYASTPNLLHQLTLPVPSSSVNGVVFSNPTNGKVYAGVDVTGTTFVPVVEIDMMTGVVSDICIAAGLTNIPQLYTYQNKLVAIGETHVHLYEIEGITDADYPTRAIDTSDISADGILIRIPRNKIAGAIVEACYEIDIGDNTKTALQSQMDYIELAITDDDKFSVWPFSTGS